MTEQEDELTVFICSLKKDHACDSDGPTIYGGPEVPITKEMSRAGKGYTWSSVTCSVCGQTAMENDMWKDWS